jgi:ribonuclease HI
MISIYADGSSCGNSVGAIGWGYVIVRDGEILVKGSAAWETGTNNIAELLGAIDGLIAASSLAAGDSVELVSDSQYVLGLASGVCTPKKNIDLAIQVKILSQQLKAQTRWVRGHAGDKFNEMCDALATSAKKKLQAAKASKNS